MRNRVIYAAILNSIAVLTTSVEALGASGTVLEAPKQSLSQPPKRPRMDDRSLLLLIITIFLLFQVQSLLLLCLHRLWSSLLPALLQLTFKVSSLLPGLRRLTKLFRRVLGTVGFSHRSSSKVLLQRSAIPSSVRLTGKPLSAPT